MKSWEGCSLNATQVPSSPIHSFITQEAAAASGLTLWACGSYTQDLRVVGEGLQAAPHTHTERCTERGSTAVWPQTAPDHPPRPGGPRLALDQALLCDLMCDTSGALAPHLPSQLPQFLPASL